MKPSITLEQWQALLAVVDAGGYAAAAEALGKSQSSISYAVGKLESVLNVRVFQIEGRRAVLTEAGKVLYQRARTLVEEAGMIEELAAQYAAGEQVEVKIAVDTIFPEWLILNALQEFSDNYPQCRLEVLETVLSGTDEALLRREVDIAICSRIPTGFHGSPLMQIRFVAVAHPDHPLHQQDSPLSYQQLRRHRQLVVRDSGSRRLDSGWLQAQHRLTFSNMQTSIAAATQGLGFAWFPEEKIRQHLDSGLLKPLQLTEGQSRMVDMHLVYSQADYAGPTVRALGATLSQKTRQCCPDVAI
ncbi:LysR family transcriptional regulator [Marinobacterium jannaschii]|uniref:LysR family transcriptional regulator n=1 Tax=Marinobacterium jannaschii TaxID=64970 RepID=UPI0004808EF5|nr:LysR family transcriptional regulator [Marinobacterium jannaschii]